MALFASGFFPPPSLSLHVVIDFLCYDPDFQTRQSSPSYFLRLLQLFHLLHGPLIYLFIFSDCWSWHIKEPLMLVVKLEQGSQVCRRKPSNLREKERERERNSNFFHLASPRVEVGMWN